MTGMSTGIVARMAALREAGEHALPMDACEGEDLERAAAGGGGRAARLGAGPVGGQPARTGAAGPARQLRGRPILGTGSDDAGLDDHDVDPERRDLHAETRYAIGWMAEKLLELNRTLPLREFDALVTCVW
ncbi:hypothetical protein ABZ215_03560 [Amycolatopsis sp. NPDC006131]|uniref:hypothetical protein n=1 Tax=Amycolatopsis sp. NPDC006131 TaxID=3156731 RepID=UPI0033A08204